MLKRTENFEVHEKHILLNYIKILIVVEVSLISFLC